MSMNFQYSETYFGSFDPAKAPVSVNIRSAAWKISMIYYLFLFFFLHVFIDILLLLYPINIYIMHLYFEFIFLLHYFFFCKLNLF